MTTKEIIEQLRVIDVMRNATDEESGEYLYTEEHIAKEENKINATREQKLNAIQDYRLSLDDEIKRCQEKKAKQEANIKRTKNHQEYLKELQMDLLGGEKLKTDEYTFSYRTTKSVNITDESKVLDNNIFIKTKIEVDKTAIKKAIENGDEVLGAEIIENKSLSVR